MDQSVLPVSEPAWFIIRPLPEAMAEIVWREIGGASVCTLVTLWFDRLAMRDA